MLMLIVIGFSIDNADLPLFTETSHAVSHRSSDRTWYAPNRSNMSRPSSRPGHHLFSKLGVLDGPRVISLHGPNSAPVPP
jgi:hypothetical protein